MVSSPAVRGLRAIVRATIAAGILPLALLAGCGGGARQDAGVKAATYKVDVLASSFPSQQHLAGDTALRLRIRNADNRTIPDLAVTIGGGPRSRAAEAFGSADPQAGLADSSRPVWIVNQAPGNSETAYAGTWTLGRPLKPGASASLVWKVTPVKAGSHTISYRVAGGLTGKSKVELSRGGKVHGSFKVDVSAKPPATGVGPNGNVVTLPAGSP